MSSTDNGNSDSIIRSMVIVCSVALVLFSVTYAACWYRAKDRHRNFEAPSNSNTASRNTNNNNTTSIDDGDGDDDDHDNSIRSSENTGLSTADAAPPPPKPKFTDTSYNPSKGKKQREPGEPVYDKFIIGGTASLGVLMLIGATIVLIINLVEQANYNDAKITDFVSLGQEACLIDSSADYRTYDKKINALNRMCVEEWEYSVLVFLDDQQDQDQAANNANATTASASFVTSPMSSDSCPDTCDACSSRLFGPDYYVGVDATKTGISIVDRNNNNSSNNVFVECWAPTVPVQDLSGFYPCGTQREANQTCFLLRDIRQELQERKDSTQIGLISAYSCYGGGVLLLLVVLYFKKRNQTVLQQDYELGMTQPQESFEKDQDDANANANDEAKETEETSEDEDGDDAGVPTKNQALVVEEGRADGVNSSVANNYSDTNKEDGHSKA